MTYERRLVCICDSVYELYFYRCVHLVVDVGVNETGITVGSREQRRTGTRKLLFFK